MREEGAASENEGGGMCLHYGHFTKNRKCSLQNENRMKLLSSLEDTSALFTGPAKISALGALGESYVSDVSNHFIFRRVLH